MQKLILILAVTLAACSPVASPQLMATPSLPTGLVFASGFEGGTRITGTGENQFIEGMDGTFGDWGSLKNGNNPNLDWVQFAYSYLEGGNLSIAQDPTGADNQVLRFNNTSGGRTQWQMNQVDSYWGDDGTPNKFTQQFYRYRMYIPSDITTVFAYSAWSEWYMIWENHTWEEFSNGNKTRNGIYLQKNPNSNLWYFRVMMARPGGCSTYAGSTSSCQVYWDNKVNQNIPVPFDQWFTFDVFFKYSATDGEWYVAITRDGQPRQEIAHYVGQTQFNGEKLHDQMILKLYHDSRYGETNQYYDDLEIWSDYPPGYFAATGTPIWTNTKTPTSTMTATKTQTQTASRTPTMTKSSTPTAPPTFTVTATRTPTATPTITRTATMTITPSRTPTITPSATQTPTPTYTQTPTSTPTPIPEKMCLKSVWRKQLNARPEPSMYNIGLGVTINPNATIPIEGTVETWEGKFGTINYGMYAAIYLNPSTAYPLGRTFAIMTSCP